MRRIFYLLLITGTTFFSSLVCFAGDPPPVITTEKIPGADCVCYVGGTENADGKACEGEANVAKRQYKCKLSGTGIDGFAKMFSTITKVFVYICILLGVLALVGFGIGWAMLGGDEEYAKKLKKYVQNLLIGLTILFLFGLILSFLAPWVYN